MNRISTLLALALLCLCAATASAQRAKELDPEVVEAWQEAGAKVGWHVNEPSYWKFSKTRPERSCRRTSVFLAKDRYPGGDKVPCPRSDNEAPLRLLPALPCFFARHSSWTRP